MNENLYINSIYKATEGEGLFVGTPQLFVRFQGCLIGCVNCDSKDTWSFDESSLSPFDNVVKEIQSHSPLKRISITGGDPLHPKNIPGVSKLIKELKPQGYWFNLEAAGTRVVEDLFELFDFISFDVKTPSTKVKFNEVVLEKMLLKFHHKMQVKGVVEDQKDFDFYQSVRSKFSDYKTTWVITPAFNNEEDLPFKRVDQILNWNQSLDNPFRVILQQHKVIYGADKKNV